MRHHAIVLTWKDYIDDKKSGAELRTSAAVLKDIAATGAVVTVSRERVTNGYRSAMVCPDGSKEGWQESTDGDERRRVIKAILLRECYTDGSSPWDWAEVQYGDDEGIALIADHSDARPRPSQRISKKPKNPQETREGR